jgi:hypothetical protein
MSKNEEVGMKVHCGAAAGSCNLGANTWKDRALEVCGIRQSTAGEPVGPLLKGAPTCLLTFSSVLACMGQLLHMHCNVSIQVTLALAAFQPSTAAYCGNLMLGT